jgi:hypothetical protein
MPLLAAAALAAASLPSAHPQPTSSNCPSTTSHFAGDHGKWVEPQKLTELPDANFYSAVYRRVDGCEEPIIVKYRVSGR